MSRVGGRHPNTTQPHYCEVYQDKSLQSIFTEKPACNREAYCEPHGAGVTWTCTNGPRRGASQARPPPRRACGQAGSGHQAPRVARPRAPLQGVGAVRPERRLPSCLWGTPSTPTKCTAALLQDGLGDCRWGWPGWLCGQPGPRARPGSRDRVPQGSCLPLCPGLCLSLSLSLSVS